MTFGVFRNQLVSQLRDHGYTNIDGLDPSSGLLAAAQEKGWALWFEIDWMKSILDFTINIIAVFEAKTPGLYKKTICAYVTPDTPTPIENDTYDVLLCSAGMFPGSIVPQVEKMIISFCSHLMSCFWGVHRAVEGCEAGRADRLEYSGRLRRLYYHY